MSQGTKKKEEKLSAYKANSLGTKASANTRGTQTDLQAVRFHVEPPSESDLFKPAEVSVLLPTLDLISVSFLNWADFGDSYTFHLLLALLPEFLCYLPLK